MSNKSNTYYYYSGNANVQFYMHATSTGYIHIAGGHVHIAVDFHIISTHLECRDMSTQQVHTDTHKSM